MQFSLIHPHYYLAIESPSGSIQYGKISYEPYAGPFINPPVKQETPSEPKGRKGAVELACWPDGRVTVGLKWSSGKRKWVNVVGGW